MIEHADFSLTLDRPTLHGVLAERPAWFGCKASFIAGLTEFNLRHVGDIDYISDALACSRGVSDQAFRLASGPLNKATAWSRETRLGCFDT